MKKTSLADIADALGVSKTLVSMVLNGRGDQHGINADTQKRVRDMADKLNYRPNPMARSLRTGKSNTIGLIIADIGNTFFAKVARSIEDEANKNGFNLIFSSSDENPEREKKLIAMMRNRQVDGLIIASTLSSKDSQVLDELKDEKFPFVLIDRYIQDKDYDAVVTDNHSGAKAMTQKLLDEGKKRIALFNISPSYLSPLEDRKKGYLDALKTNNIDIDNDLIIDIPFDNVDTEVKKALTNLFNGEKPDAIFTLNNNLAGSCLKHLNAMNLSVPSDVSLVSFDNVDWFEFSNPPITSVAQPTSELGLQAFTALHEKLNGSKHAPKKHTLELDLVVRNSI